MSLLLHLPTDNAALSTQIGVKTKNDKNIILDLGLRFKTPDHVNFLEGEAELCSKLKLKTNIGFARLLSLKFKMIRKYVVVVAAMMIQMNCLPMKSNIGLLFDYLHVMENDKC